MMQRLFRFAKRLTVFVPGLIIAYVSFHYTLPFFDKRLPDLLSLLATYALAAYVLIPGLIRLWRILWPPDHLPLYCITPDGFASDPLNIGLVGTRPAVILAMEKAGWHLADRYTPSHLVRHILSIVFGWYYPNAPVSNLYLFGRKQDLAFEIPVNGTNVRRHHVRFWATTFTKGDKLTVHSIHWHHRRSHLNEDELLWVGAASLDTGIMPIRHNMQITHQVHPDTNQERELIFSQLESQGVIKKSKYVKLDNPYKLVNRAWRGELHTDGRMKVVWFR